MIFRTTLFWVAFAFFAAMGLGAFLFAGSRVLSEMRVEMEAALTAELEDRANEVRDAIGRESRDGDVGAVRARIQELGQRMRARISWLARDGAVLADTDPEAPSREEGSPELREAIAHGRGVARRRRSPSSGPGKDLFVALAFPARGALDASIIRTSVSLEPIEQSLARARRVLYTGSLGVLAAAFLVSVLVSRPAVSYLRSIRKGAIRFSRFDLEHRLPVSRGGIAGETASAINRMASRFKERFRKMERERRDNETLLSSMNEGVLAVDAHDRIVVINRAARQILGLESADVVGRLLAEAVRQPHLLRMVRDVHRAPADVQGTVSLGRPPDERHLFVTCSSWIDPDRGEVGVLIMLNDVTRLKRLENVRRDFVANVSHELRTPITSIRGFAETLLEGEVGADDARRFHQIIAREARRLHEMLEDLLVLASVEKEAEGAGIERSVTRLSPVVDAAVANCRKSGANKNIRVLIECSGEIEAAIHAKLLEQALTNLVENAIRYSDPDRDVHVSVEARGGEVVLAVDDRGWGIAREHLPRIFERFYRVSQARERRNGGTGLGLAIVKHIAQAHGGFVTVDSEPGRGSRFEIHLPAG